MIRTLFAFAIALMVSGVAGAAEFRIGQAVVPFGYQQGGNAYYDTYPGKFCGTKAIRLQVQGRDNQVENGRFDIGRVYFAYETPAEHGPFKAYVKVNTTLRRGQSTGWINIPNYGCLKKVRVYASGAYGSNINVPVGSGFIDVIGLK